MGRDEPADFYIQELEELELDEEPTVTHDPLPNLPPAPRASGLAARAAPPPKTAEDLVKAAFQQQRAEAEAEAQAALEEKRRVAAEARARIEAAKRAAEQREREEREAMEQARADREAFEAVTRSLTPAGGVPRRPARPRPAQRRASTVTVTDPMSTMLTERRLVTILERLDDGFDVQDVYVDLPVAVIGPLWESHVVRALHDNDLPTALAADAVRSLIKGRPTDLVAARVVRGGVEFAMWVDLDDERVLAALTPAAVYLVGLS